MDQKEKYRKLPNGPWLRYYAKAKLNFSQGLNGTITTMLGSTQPTHPNAKTL
jgi:hypothetical protein